MNTGDIITRLTQIRAFRRQLAAEDQRFKDEAEQLEDQLVAIAVDSGSTRFGNNEATVIISEETVPTVNDWDALYTYIQENNAFHLLQRRINSAPWRELLELGQQIPGTEPTTLKKVNLRKV